MLLAFTGGIFTLYRGGLAPTCMTGHHKLDEFASVLFSPAVQPLHIMLRLLRTLRTLHMLLHTLLAAPHPCASAPPYFCTVAP